MGQLVLLGNLPLDLSKRRRLKVVEKMSNDSSPGGSQLSLAEQNGEVKYSDVLTLPNLRLVEPNDQIRELQTIIRDK